MIAIDLDRKWLEVSWEPLQILFRGQHGHGLRPKEIAVPDRQKAHKYRQVFLEWSGAEVLVHPVETKQHGLKIVRADGDHGGEADGGGHRIAAPDPVPKLEHVRGIDTKLRDL